MKEQAVQSPAIFGITEEIYRHTPISRRTFLQIPFYIAAADLVAACAPQRVEQSPPQGDMIRREVGTWSTEEVISTGRAMIAEAQFPNITGAGKALVQNQQGEKSLSALSSLYADNVVAIRTAASINEGTQINGRAPMAAAMVTLGPGVDVPITELADRSITTVGAPSGLQLKEIIIDEKEMKDKSDFLHKFFIAKEVVNLQAFDMLLTYAKMEFFDTAYTHPDDPRYDRAVKLLGLRAHIEDMPVTAMADLWAHFLMAPDYLIAAEQGRFSKEDLANDGEMINGFKTPAQIFLREGTLRKNDQGDYAWTVDGAKFYQSFVDTALAGYRRGVLRRN